MRLTPDKKLHSREHLLADDLSKALGELEKFAAYLGIAKRYYESDLRALARRVLEKDGLPPEARGKYFFAALRDKARRPEAKSRRKKRRKKNPKEKNHMPKEPNRRPVVREPNKILRKKAADIPVAEIATAQIQRLITDMQNTLAATKDGVGLAAPQVSKSLRIFIVSEEAEEIDRAEKSGWERRQKDNPEIKIEKPYEVRPWKYYVFINPVVKNSSRRKIDGPEGCLSVPGKFGTVARYEKITVEARNEQGKKFARGASRFFARVIQHELDHLEGTLFIDKAKNLMAAPQEENQNKNGD